MSRALAHDFNNILEVISSNVYLALPDIGVPETTRARLQAISAASQKATALVRRLMQFGRSHTLESQAVQINDLITGVVLGVSTTTRESGLDDAAFASWEIVSAGFKKRVTQRRPMAG